MEPALKGIIAFILIPPKRANNYLLSLRISGHHNETGKVRIAEKGLPKGKTGRPKGRNN